MVLYPLRIHSARVVRLAHRIHSRGLVLSETMVHSILSILSGKIIHSKYMILSIYMTHSDLFCIVKLLSTLVATKLYRHYPPVHRFTALSTVWSNHFICSPKTNHDDKSAAHYVQLLCDMDRKPQ